jgi:hypothetical protein
MFYVIYIFLLIYSQYTGCVVCNLINIYCISRVYSRPINHLGINDIYSYTDWHNVDEDMTTVIKLGGCWPDHIQVGIAMREVYDYPSTMLGHVAFEKK